MATTGGTDSLQRNVDGENHTIQDLGQPLTQRSEIVAVGTGASATGTRSVCIGYNASDAGRPSNVIVGPENTATSALGVVIGSNNQALSDIAVMAAIQSVVAAGSALTVTLGYQLNTTGTTIINAGFNNTLGAGSAQSVVVGSDLLCGTSCAVSVVLGRSIHVDVAGSLTQSVVIGGQIGINLGAKVNLVLLGQAITTTNTFRHIAIGNDITSVAAASAARIISIGDTLSNIDGSDLTIIGAANTVGGGSAQSVMVGSDILTNVGCTVSVLVGRALHIDASGGLVQSVVVGSQITVNLTNKVNLVLLGQAITTSGTYRLIAVGNEITANASTSGVRVIAIGSALTSGNATDVTLIGTTNQANGTTQQVVELGSNLTVDTAGSNLVLVGNALHTTNCNSSVLVGNIITIAGGGAASNSIAAVGTNLIIADSCSGSVILAQIATVYGSGNVVIGNGVIMSGVGGSGNVLIGQTVFCLTGVSNVIAIGQTCTAGAGTTGSILLHGSVGTDSGTSITMNGSISTDSPNSINIGGTINATCPRTTIVGVSSAVTTLFTDCTGIGYSLSLLGTGAIAIGSSASAIAHQCVVGSDSVNGEITNFSIRCDALGTYFQVYSTPIATETGMILPFHDGSSVVAKQVKAAAVPTVGSLLLYIDP